MATSGKMGEGVGGGREYIGWLSRYHIVWAPPAAGMLDFVHLASVFYIIAYLPYSKLAHLVYRTVAMGYAAYIGREFGIEVSAIHDVERKDGRVPCCGRRIVAHLGLGENRASRKSIPARRQSVILQAEAYLRHMGAVLEVDIFPHLP